ncbi:sel1 repeat family protein [Ectopseudomonas mendocina]|uniref:Sel1 repeat family protein n=1 Tax=Ectopseudomonas mendocina TaxID=300 RepID=A0ABZ2RCK3_ECTME
MLFKKLGLLFLSLLICSTGMAEKLTEEQQAAKTKGINLYNQYKDGDPYLRVAAEAGDREAQYYLAESLRLDNRYMTEEAYKWYVAAAKQGDYYAMFRLADTKDDLCSFINSCPGNIKDYRDWVRLLWKTAEPLAEGGDAEAMLIMYNTTGDVEWIEKSAGAGYPDAQYYLAAMYEEGKGFFFPPWRRAEKIEELYRKSAEGGFPKGMMMYAGLLIEKGDLQAAREWTKKGAETGFETMLYNYGSYLAHEPDKIGYELDLVRGYGIISLLLELDGGGGTLYLTEEKLKKIAAKMTPEQIEEAKAFAQEWKATHPPLSFFPDKLGF